MGGVGIPSSSSSHHHHGGGTVGWGVRTSDEGYLSGHMGGLGSLGVMGDVGVGVSDGATEDGAAYPYLFSMQGLGSDYLNYDYNHQMFDHDEGLAPGPGLGQGPGLSQRHHPYFGSVPPGHPVGLPLALVPAATAQGPGLGPGSGSGSDGKRLRGAASPVTGAYGRGLGLGLGPGLGYETELTKAQPLLSSPSVLAYARYVAAAADATTLLDGPPVQYLTADAGSGGGAAISSPSHDHNNNSRSVAKDRTLSVPCHYQQPTNNITITNATIIIINNNNHSH